MATPRRIALAITELEVGGAERCLTELALRLDRERFEPFVYCLGPRPTPEKSLLVDRLESAGVPLRWCGGASWRSFPQVAWRLRRFLRRDRPELVQCFLHHANVLVPPIARLCGVKHVLGGVRVAERRYPRRAVLERRVDLCIARWVCVSGSTADYMANVVGVPTAKLCIIPNGVDVARFDEAQPPPRPTLGVTGDRPLVVYVGRLDPQKGLDVLLEAIAAAPSVVGDCDFALVGRGPSEESLQRQAAELGIAERFHFAGWRTDVPEILKSADVLVLPSRWEGMPNVVLEAMAAGLPVACSLVEGVAEALGDGAAVQTCPPDDAEALSNLLAKLLADEALRASLGAANRRRAEEHFSLPAMVAQYEAIFEELLYS